MISKDFTIEDIREIRNNHYEENKHKSLDLEYKELKSASIKANKRISEIRKNKRGFHEY